MADYYGKTNTSTWGCAPPAARSWWNARKCNPKHCNSPLCGGPGCKVGAKPSWECTQEELPTWQLWAKGLLGGETAILVLNIADAPLKAGSVSVATSEVGFGADSGTSYDVWKMNAASFSGGAVAVPTLGAHECFFAILSPSSERSAA